MTHWDICRRPHQGFPPDSCCGLFTGPPVPLLSLPTYAPTRVMLCAQIWPPQGNLALSHLYLANHLQTEISCSICCHSPGSAPRRAQRMDSLDVRGIEESQRQWMWACLINAKGPSGQLEACVFIILLCLHDNSSGLLRADP